MCRFIKFTISHQTSSGKRDELLYINLDHVAKASYNTTNGSLSLYLAHFAVSDGSQHIFTITGTEAEEALRKLQEAP